jgi:hypothetical protein
VVVKHHILFLRINAVVGWEMTQGEESLAGMYSTGHGRGRSELAEMFCRLEPRAYVNARSELLAKTEADTVGEENKENQHLSAWKKGL